MSRTIDLNADVGEERGDDAALLRLVSSANVATGAHAGGGDVLLATVGLAVAAGCAVGAHPSYPDREGFGRRRPPTLGSPEGLVRELIAQVLAVEDAVEAAGSRLSHVKPHGSLYNDATDDEGIAACVVDAVIRAAHERGREVRPLVGMPDSLLEGAARARAVPYIREAFADRAYDDRGRLVARSTPGAVLVDEQEIRRRVIDIAVHRRVSTLTGGMVPISAQSICLHGDSPGAVRMAKAARAELLAAGFTVAHA